MKNINGISSRLPWLLAIGLSSLVTACGGGGQAPILGAGNIDTVMPAVPPSVAPGVTAVTPLPNTVGVALNTQTIAAAFNKPMNAATLNAGSFTLACPAATPINGGTVTYVAASQIATLILSSNTALPANSLCTATVTTAAKDSTGLAMANNYVWQFSTGAAPDTTAPTVTNTVNANGASNVAINTKVGATFSEAMNPLSINNTNVTMKQGGTAVLGTIAYSGVSMVFVPASNLSPNTTYTVTINSSATDLAGNALTEPYQWSWTTGAAPDTTAPTVTNTVNANGASNVPVNTKVDATFSEAMNPLTINNTSFTLKQTLGGAAVAGIASYSGVNALFVPNSALASNTNYTATISTVAADLAGNPMTSDYIWNWTTAMAADTTKPLVINTIIENGAANVATNTRVDATFSESLNPLSVTNVNFTLKETVSGAPVAGIVSYAGTDVVFTPSANLQAGTQYTATLKGDTNGVEDLAGNAMAADYSWSWTTASAADTTAPLVTLVNPAESAQNVALTSAVNATFNEAMDPLTITTANFKVAGVTGVVSFNALTKVATFTPNAALTAGTTYTATVTRGALDLAGNALAIDKVWTFATAAIPVVIPVIPVIPLNTAAPFGTFGGSAGMTNMGTLTQVNGDIGTIATGTSMVTGFHDTAGDIYTETPSNMGTVNGKIFTCTTSTTGPTSAVVNAPACAAATQARLDAQTAYLALVATPVGGASPAPGANLASLTLLPGTYKSASGSFMIQGGDLTLDAQGDANATWVFQMATTLTVGGPGAAFPQSITLAGGAQAKNVFWQVGSFATINAAGGGTMVGTLIAQEGASFSTAGNVSRVTLNGRVLSLGASVTMVNTVINVPQ